VLRVADVFIVLALAANPSSALFCTTWCDDSRMKTVVTEVCHRDAVPNAANVAGDYTCERLLLDRMAFIREDTVRLASSSVAYAGILVSGYEFRRVAADNYPLVNRSASTLSTRTRLSPNLRI
jgi:hypothetical protein